MTTMAVVNAIQKSALPINHEILIANEANYSDVFLSTVLRPLEQ